MSEGTRLYTVLGVASCIAVLYLNFGHVRFIPLWQPYMSFVGRNGSQFVVDGKAMYINGWNSYWLMDQSVGEWSRHRTKTILKRGAQMGLNVVRTWAFNDGGYNALQISPGVFDESVFRVAETRFASHTIVLRRLVRVKEALCQMVISNKWGGWKQVDTKKAKIVKNLIFSDDFWNRVEYALELTEPLMSMLRYADTDEPCLGNIYDAMDSMLERMKSVIQRREQDPDTLYSTVEKIVLHRWNKMTTPLHLLAYALSPRYYSSEILDIPGRVPPYRDPEVAAGYKRALNRLFSDPDVASNVRREFVDFVSGKFAEPDAINDQSRLDAIGWWYLHGERYMYLQPLAIKILSQALDFVIVEARRNGLRLIFSLVNNLNAYGGKDQYVQWAYAAGVDVRSSNDSFFDDPTIRGYYKDYVKKILTRKNSLSGVEYRNEPAIFAWELINEPRCMSDPSGHKLQAWIEEMAKFVKSLDNKHLLTIGLEGFYGQITPDKFEVNPGYWAASLGSDFINNSQVDQIDFASVHAYPDSWIPDVELEDHLKYISKWATSHIDDGEHTLKKPVLFTEFGLSSHHKGFEPSQRDLLFKFMYDKVYESARRGEAGAGALVWQFFVEGMEEYRDHYAFVPWQFQSTYKLIMEQSCRLLTLSEGELRGNQSLHAACPK